MSEVGERLSAIEAARRVPATGIPTSIENWRELEEFLDAKIVTLSKVSASLESLSQSCTSNSTSSPLVRSLVPRRGSFVCRASARLELLTARAQRLALSIVAPSEHFFERRQRLAARRQHALEFIDKARLLDLERELENASESPAGFVMSEFGRENIDILWSLLKFLGSTRAAEALTGAAFAAHGQTA